MIEIAELRPHVEVDEAEYVRLLGYPPGWVLTDRAAELAAWARAWYAAHGRPWVFGRPARECGIVGDAVVLEGVRFGASRLHDRLHRAGAHAAVLVAASAGPELEAEAGRLWAGERPDEYFFLEIYGSAVVEHLITTAGARLCAWADTQALAVLPHDSPGYRGWDAAQQPALLALLERHGPLPGPLGALESGALAPKKSQLAVFGLTRHVDRVQQLTTLVPCQTCSLAGCAYRRRPYRRGAPAAAARSQVTGHAPPLRAAAPYRTATRALDRWTRERLTMTTRRDGGVDAVFRYDGTTCTNMGRELTFLYRVTLGPPEDGYPILAQHCAPAPGDAGHAAMCGYLREGDRLLAEVAAETPLAGRPLDDVLSWNREGSTAGCYCEPSSREHKWGLVLETIHYALAGRERSQTDELRG